MTAAAPATDGTDAPPTIRGVVVDAQTGEPIARAAVAPAGMPAFSLLTDPAGRFELRTPDRGATRLVIQHVAYETAEVSVPYGSVDVVRVALEPHAHVLDPVEVEATAVTPLTSGQTASYTLPPAMIRQLPIDDAIELMQLLPGVVVVGDRPFFRGLSFEHVVPLIDGVPARDPIDGEWILPPPDGIGSAELIAGAFGVEHAALSGVLDVRVAEGGATPRARVSYATDRIDVAGSARTDVMDVTAGGPTTVDGLRVAAAWQGRLADGHLAYQRGRPRHDLLGIGDFGARMNGSQSASLRLTYVPVPEGASAMDTAPAPPAAGSRASREPPAWKLSTTLLHVARKGKIYHHNYSRAGWVGYEPKFSRYTTYLESPDDADSVVWNDAQLHVPLREQRSTMLMSTYERVLGDAFLSFHARVAEHRKRVTPPGRDIDSVEELRSWIRNDITDAEDQTEWFYATHGDQAAFDDVESVEGSLGGRGSVPIGEHRVAFGAGGTLARHRIATIGPASPGEVLPVGSFDVGFRTFDGHAYLEDLWKPDAFSSMRLGVRMDTRHVNGFGASGSATAFSPRISFHQPMTDVDALHVQAGNLVQFPTYRSYAPRSLDLDKGFTIQAQRTRAFEVGLQRHVSRKIVTYLGLYLRQSVDVVFVAREPSTLDLLFVTPQAIPSTAVVESQGAELTIDHQLHPAVSGQVTVTLGQTTINDRETAWSRRSTIHSTLLIRPDRRVRIGISSRWSSGRPYSVCIKSRAECLEGERHEGRLPHTFTTDLRVAWSFARGNAIRLFGEVRNVFDRRTPTFDFGIRQSSVGVANFIAYYDEFGENGYLIDTGNDRLRFDEANPAARTPGRTLRLGMEVSL